MASEVELMKRYSNPVYQGRQLRRIVEIMDESAKMPIREPVGLPQTQRLDRRLPAETIAALVQAYRDGVSTTELRRRYEISHGSIIKILHGHDVTMRNHGLADSDVSTAAALYRGGANLARLGERFGLSPNAVRRALVSAGVVMQERGGNQPRR